MGFLICKYVPVWIIVSLRNEYKAPNWCLTLIGNQLSFTLSPPPSSLSILLSILWLQCLQNPTESMDFAAFISHTSLFGVGDLWCSILTKLVIELCKNSVLKRKEETSPLKMEPFGLGTVWYWASTNGGLPHSLPQWFSAFSVYLGKIPNFPVPQSVNVKGLEWPRIQHF